MASTTHLLRRWQVGRRPILILGHGRSGTTWVGKVISAARRVLYYFEPLHPARSGTADLLNWFRYARPGDEDEAMAETFDPIFAGLSSPAKAWNRSGLHRWIPGYRVAVKDVASVMAVEWLAHRYGPKVVLIVRHPGAVILSELRQGTPAGQSLAAILTQKQVIEYHLKPYVGILKEAKSEIEQLAAVWAARHRVVADGLQRHPEWLVVCYENLCADPVGQFRELFAALDLRWSRAMETYVNRHSTVAGEGAYSIQRVSNRQIDEWRGRMADRDVAQVQEITRALEIPFYGQRDEWTLAKFLR